MLIAEQLLRSGFSSAGVNLIVVVCRIIVSAALLLELLSAAGVHIKVSDLQTIFLVF
jgi:hypothetical protein